MIFEASFFNSSGSWIYKINTNISLAILNSKYT